MSGEEFVIAIVAIISISIVLIVGISKLTGLIKAWLNRHNQSYSDESFDRLAKAFTQYKRDTEKRLQNLEAIVTEEDTSSPDVLKQTYKTIEIEDKEETKKSDTANSGLKNMLRE